MREVRSNETFLGLMDNVSDGILAIDSNWLIIYANKAAGMLLKRDAKSLWEKNIWKEFPGSVGNSFYKTYHKAIKTQKKQIVEGQSKIAGKWIRAAVYPSRKGIVVYFHDITGQRKAELKANKSEEDFRVFLDRVTDGFIALDKNFCYVYVNNKIGELVNRKPESLIGKNVWEEFPDAVNSLTYKAFQTAMKEQRFISNIDYYEPLQLWQENYIYPSPEGLSIFIKDISDRKKLEKALQEKERDRQFELMISTLEAQEKERTHIGRELHDNVNQLLVATKLILAMQRDDPALMNKQVISKAIENLEKAIEENRRISHDLVTPDLEEESLVDQLRFLLQNMLVSNGIKVSIEASGFNEKGLDITKRLVAYRIAQEQCTNIVKYSKAKAVSVKLLSDENLFTMIIADDGIGMDKNKLTAGIGLKNIAGRVNLLGGELHITTARRKGFILEVQIPTETKTISTESFFQRV